MKSVYLNTFILKNNGLSCNLFSWHANKISSKFACTLGLIFILFFFTQCGIAHLMTIRKSDYEPRSEYNQYLAKHNIDTTFSYQLKPIYLDSLSNKKYSLNLYKTQHQGNPSVLQLRMYDNKGKFIYGHEQCFGDVDAFPILDSLPFKKVEYLPVNMNLLFINDLNWIQLTGEQRDKLVILNNKYPYTIIAAYAVWPGWYSHHTLRRLNKYVNTYGKENFLLICVNMTRMK